MEENPVLQDVWVRAEISNFTHHSRGHMYFTLKDEAARIRTVMFAGNNQFLKFLPKNGLKVLVRGEVNVYERDGQYQFYVKEMQPDGIGALYQAFEDLKQKLEQRGWFASEIKKSLPLYPKTIGVITSPTGAAIRDIITTIKRRYPIVKIKVFPVMVQGEQAAPSIAKAIRLAHLEDIDVLIVGRGGGSIEELWAFNEEIVAKEIFAASIPIISAVGHETDFTIADFVADLRAATPTAAAEQAVPLLAELHERVQQRKEQLSKALVQQLKEKRKELLRLQQSYAFKYPKQLLVQKEQEFDQLLQQLQRNMKRYMEQQKQNLSTVERGLRRYHSKDKLPAVTEKTLRLKERLQRQMNRIVDKNKQTLYFQSAQLDAHSPLKIMNKGYSLVYNQDKQKLYKSVFEIEPGQPVQVVMKDGELDCHVWGIKEAKKSE